MAELRSTLVQQRWPFLPLVFGAAAGIVAASCLPCPAWAWGFLATVGFAMLWTRWTSAAFGLFLCSAFALLQVWQTRDSPGARLAIWLGDQAPIVEVTGLVVEEPRTSESGRSSFRLELQAWTTSSATKLPSGLRVIASLKNGTPPAYGDVVAVRGVLANIRPPRNPGQFDFARWSQRQGLYSSISIAHPNDLAILETNQGNPLVALALQLRQWMAERLTSGMNDPAVSDLLLGMVLGDTSTMDQQVQEDFRGTGTFHLFSVSGLHVGILAVILLYALKALGLPRPVTAGMVIPLLFFYVLMTGLKAPSLRAAMMATVVLVGLMAQRKPILFNNLCAAGFLILLIDTNQLFNPGFQLSFTVVAAILLLGELISRRLEKPFEIDPFLPRKLLSRTQRAWHTMGIKLAGLTATSAAAWLGSFPLTLGYFHLVSLSAILANLVAVPLSFAIMAVSTLSLLSGSISSWMADVFNQTNWLLARMLLGIIHAFAVVPHSYFYVAMPDFTAAEARIVVFDFGAGGAAAVSSRGKHWLLDSGPAWAHDSTIVPFLRSQGVSRLDGFLITHGDAQHIGGAGALLRSAPPVLAVESLWKDRSSTRTEWRRALEAASQPKRLLRAGDVVPVSDRARLRVLYPPAKISGLADDAALVLLLEVGATRVLFLSDSGHATERWLLDHAREELSCDILVKGAHRDGGELSAEFLHTARPKVAICSAADFPENERMTESLVDALTMSGIALFRQDETGAVTVSIEKTGWSVQAFTTSQRFVYEY